jgi:DNA-binding NarL/FixJ family response regulator
VPEGRGDAPSGSRIRVVVADESALLREGICAMLEGHLEIELVGVCASAAELERLIATRHPHVVVVDADAPAPNGRADESPAARLHAIDPSVGIVVLAGQVEPEVALELIGSGQARGYLLKDRIHDAPELIRAIRAVSDGRTALDPAVLDAMIEERRRETQSQLSELTARELEILSQIAEGASNAAIAESLVLTKRAVEKHVHSIFAKLGLAESQTVSRRVKATLMYLAERGGARRTRAHNGNGAARR